MASVKLIWLTKLRVLSTVHTLPIEGSTRTENKGQHTKKTRDSIRRRETHVNRHREEHKHGGNEGHEHGGGIVVNSSSCLSREVKGGDG